MKFVQACLVTGLVFGIPAVTSAQQIKGIPSDIEYCNALGKAYSSMFPAMEAMPASDAVTMDRCNTHTRVSIVALEDKLKNKKIELPPHVGVASSH